MDYEREADRIRSFIEDLENESEADEYDYTSGEGNNPDDSEYSDVEEAQIPVQQNSDTEESDEEELDNTQNVQHAGPFYLGRNGPTP